MMQKIFGHRDGIYVGDDPHDGVIDIVHLFTAHSPAGVDIHIGWVRRYRLRRSFM